MDDLYRNTTKSVINDIANIMKTAKDAKTIDESLVNNSQNYLAESGKKIQASEVRTEKLAVAVSVTEARELLESAGANNVRVASNHIVYDLSECEFKIKQLSGATSHRYVSGADLEEALDHVGSLVESPASYAKIRDKFEKNEDENRHSENAVLLAKHIGTKADHDEAKDILKQHNAIGHLTSDLSTRRSALYDKFSKSDKYKKIFSEGVEKFKDEDDVQKPSKNTFKRGLAKDKEAQKRNNRERKYDDVAEEALDEISHELRQKWLSATFKNHAKHTVHSDDGKFTFSEPLRSPTMPPARAKTYEKQDEIMRKEYNRKADEEHKTRLASRTPKVHDLRHLSHGEVYDKSQTSDKIHDGDVMHVKGGVAMLYRAWPVMTHGESKILHTFKDGDNIHTVDGGRYHKTADLADKVAQKSKEMKESTLHEATAHEKVMNHPAVESADDGGKGNYFVNLKKPYHWSGQRSFGVDKATDALKMLKDVEKGTPGVDFEESVNEAATLRLLKTHSNEDGSRVAKVYKDTDWGEHRVKFYKNGTHQQKADYHTDDKDDAHDSAKSWVNQKNEARDPDDLVGDQYKIDSNKNGKIDKEDFRLLALKRAKAKNIESQKKAGREKKQYAESYDSLVEALSETDAHEAVKSHPFVASVKKNNNAVEGGKYSFKLKSDYNHQGDNVVHADDAHHALRILKQVKSNKQFSTEARDPMDDDGYYTAHETRGAKQHEYNKDAVDKAIKSSRQKIGGKEAKLIHSLLKGRTPEKKPVDESAASVNGALNASRYVADDEPPAKLSKNPMRRAVAMAKKNQKEANTEKKYCDESVASTVAKEIVKGAAHTAGTYAMKKAITSIQKKINKTED